MLSELTNSQRIAATTRGGKLLVSAAAGSGKTRVLVERLLCYLTDPVSPAQLDDFLIITYTKAAAAELRGKIGAELTARIADNPENRHLQKQLQRLYLTQISTVHGFCTQLLREYAYMLDIAPDFRVADETETGELRSGVLSDMLDRAYVDFANHPDFLAFVDTQGLGRDDRKLPNLILKVYDSARCHLNPAKWLSECEDTAGFADVADVSETPAGQYLLSDLKTFLEGYIEAFTLCIKKAEEIPEFAKVSANLNETLLQMRTLANAETWDNAVSNIQINFGTLTFPRNNPDLLLTAQIKAVRDSVKKKLAGKAKAFSRKSADLLADTDSISPAVRGLIMLVKQFSDDYTRLKRSRRILDFSDLEHCTLDLLLGKSRTGPTAVSREIAHRYREVLVDEYQDSNSVQDAIFSVLTQTQNNCFLVGDVKQSIYRFRLADPKIFLEKYKAFPDVSPGMSKPAQKVLLSDNFRSGKEVIAAVNDVFRVCMSPDVGGLYYTEAEALHEGIPHIPLPDPSVELYTLETTEETNAEEAAFVAEKIRSMIGRTLIRNGDMLRPAEPDDIVILLRSPSSIGAAYRQALENAGIRCSMGGGTDLLQTREIENLRNLLRTVANPLQDIPLISTLVSPLFGFTADDLAGIRGKRTKISFYEALSSSNGEKEKHFLTILAELRLEAQRNDLIHLLSKCYLLTKIDSIYGAMPGGKAKKENLRQFFQLAAAYEPDGACSLNRFLDHLNNLQSNGIPAAAGSGSGCVTIMSIHKSKGLEFPIVFLSGLSHKFNRDDLQEHVLCDPELGLGLNSADTALRIRYPSLSRYAIGAKIDRESTSEELRVLYVAMTRAKDRLIMTYAAKKLTDKLQNIAARLPYDSKGALFREALCPGDWVLGAAMGRADAGELRKKGDYVGEARWDDVPWKIQVCSEPAQPESAADQALESETALSAEDIAALQAGLSFRYPHEAATRAPSKQTATGMKGRQKDGEAAEDTVPKAPVHVTNRLPSFLGTGNDSLSRGNAIHAVMQYLNFSACTGTEEIQQEVARLVSCGLLTPEQSKMIDCAQIALFFESEIGRRLRSGVKCLREFKFSILEPGEKFGENLEGEEILMQGVVDCAIFDEHGITVIDFKTDRVNAENLSIKTAHYRQQVEVYAQALTRIFRTPIFEKYLYFFSVNRFVRLD